AGQRLRLLPGVGEDGRRLLPGLPVVLEPGGVLPVRTAPAAVGGPRRGGAAGAADVRAVALPVPDAAGPAQPGDEPAERAVGGAALGHPVAAAGGRPGVRPGPPVGGAVAVLPGLLHAGVVADHAAAVAPEPPGP